MVSKFDAFIDSEYCGTDLLAEQLAQADFAREVIREAEANEDVLSSAPRPNSTRSPMCSIRETRISAREKYLVIDEAKIRLSKIGKELKQNVGRRGGGGFDIYNTNETENQP